MLARPGLLLTAAAGLLTACAPRAWPLLTGILLLAALAITMTPFERIVILLCILRRTDPCPYLRLPESARQNNAARVPRQARCQHGYYRKDKAKTQSGETLIGRQRLRQPRRPGVEFLAVRDGEGQVIQPGARLVRVTCCDR